MRKEYQASKNNIIELRKRAAAGDELAAAQLKIAIGDFGDNYGLKKSGMMDLLALNASNYQFASTGPSQRDLAAITKRANKDIDLKNTLSAIGANKAQNPLSYFGSLRSNIAVAQDFETKRALQRELY